MLRGFAGNPSTYPSLRSIKSRSIHCVGMSLMSCSFIGGKCYFSGAKIRIFFDIRKFYRNMFARITPYLQNLSLNRRRACGYLPEIRYLCTEHNLCRLSALVNVICF